MKNIKDEVLKQRIVWECKSCGKIIFSSNCPYVCSCGSNLNYFCNNQVNNLVLGLLDTQEQKMIEEFKEEKRKLMEKIGDKFYYFSEYDGIDLKLNELEEYEDFKRKELKTEVEKIE